MSAPYDRVSEGGGIVNPERILIIIILIILVIFLAERLL